MRTAASPQAEPRYTQAVIHPRQERLRSMDKSGGAWSLTDEQLAQAPLVFREGLLEGQVVLVSGGGGGFGRAMAYVFARLGARVAICGRRPERLQRTADGIRHHLGLEVFCRSMTIRDPAQVAGLFADVVGHHGRLDILVNNAGGQFPQAALDYSVKGWHAVIDTNLNGTWYMMQQAARHWRDAGAAGSIINIVAGVERGMPQIAHSCAARAGVIYLSKSVAVEWAPLAIRVNCIAAGAIASDGLDVYEPAVAESFRVSNPMLKLGDVLDIAQGAAYLAAPSARYVTGEVLHIDGGRQMWGEDWPGGIPEAFRRDAGR
jgi:NAD(P)-dependent dehydrogenase (short-subunit alcohol dehydrogenase family)